MTGPTCSDRRHAVRWPDVPGCLSAHQDEVEACAIPHKTAFVDHFGEVETAAAKAAGAGLIDLTARICVDDPCSVVVNG